MIRFEQEPTVVLHRRPYKENAYLLEILTLNYGRLRAVARIKKQKTYRLTGDYAPFSVLKIAGQCKTELATIYSSELQETFTPQASYLLNSFYINELLLHLLPYHHATPEIFQIYLSTIQQCSAAKIRYFEYRLIEFLEIIPVVETTGDYYQIGMSQGIMQFIAATGGYSHELVMALLSKQFPYNHPQLKQLLQEIIQRYSQYKPSTRSTAVALKQLLMS